MPTPPLKAYDTQFPMQGLHEDSAETQQPNGTTDEAQNVRSYDLRAKRDRGCQRVGLSKYVAEAEDTVPIDMIVVGIIDGSFTPTGPETDGPTPPAYTYAFTAGVFEIPSSGGTIMMTFTTNDPSPQLSDFAAVFVAPTQVPSDLTNMGGDVWQLTIDCGATPFVDNIYRRQDYVNSDSSASASSNFVKFHGTATDTPGYPPDNVPIDWP